MVGECWNHLLFSSKENADGGAFPVSATNLEATVFVTLPPPPGSILAAAQFSKSYFPDPSPSFFLYKLMQVV